MTQRNHESVGSAQQSFPKLLELHASSAVFMHHGSLSLNILAVQQTIFFIGNPFYNLGKLQRVFSKNYWKQCLNTVPDL